MAETWEVIIWVIAAVVLLIIILAVIASVLYCRKRNRRKKASRRKRALRREGDETDYSKAKVQYSVKKGEAKILDELDSGHAPASHVKKVQYDARSGEAMIVDVVDHDARLVEEKLVQSSQTDAKQERTSMRDEGIPTPSERDETKKFSENYMFKSSRTKGEKIEHGESLKGSIDANGSQVSRELSQSKQRERLEPVDLLQTRWPGSAQPSGDAQRSVTNYTNMGYTETSLSRYEQQPLASEVKFQQPVAVVRAIVHPGSTTKFQKAKSLPRNFSKLSYKKSFSTSTTPRRKPLSNTWYLEAKDSKDPPGWIEVPIRFSETYDPIRRRKMLKYTTSADSVYPYRRGSSGYRRRVSERREDVDSRGNLARWKFNRSVPHRRSKRSLEKRSLRKQREKRLGESRRAPSINDIYITDSQPSRSYEDDVISTDYYKESFQPENRHHKRSVDQQLYRPVGRYMDSPPPGLSRSGREDVTDYYKENYEMVRRSEFPGKVPVSGRKDVEPDMASIISGSEFSDFRLTPPRPSDSQSSQSSGSSDDQGKRWTRSEGREDYMKSHDKYSFGSYKEYGQKVRKEGGDAEEETKDGRKYKMVNGYDQTRHLESFQDALEDLKNGNGRKVKSVKRELPSPEPACSPWINNDNNFRKAHGVPMSGVPVLPPQPVFIQMESTDSSDNEVTKNDQNGLT